MLSTSTYILLGFATLFGTQSLLVASAPALGSFPYAAQEPTQARRPGYTYTPGIGAHKVHSQKTTWNSARRICDQDGGHLAIINSVAEAQIIVQLLNQSGSPHGYLGVHDLYGEDEFVTIHGDPLTRTGFDEWRQGEPNNSGANGENCVALFTDGKLNDISCHLRIRFICELPHVEANLSQDFQRPEATEAPEVELIGTVPTWK